MPSDSGWELYGGEAALALATAGRQLGEERYLLAAARALGAYRRRYESGEVAPDELVFFANWQCQAGAAVLAAARARQRQQLQLQSTAAPGVPVEQVADYLRSLQRDIADSGFYHSIARVRRDAVVVVGVQQPPSIPISQTQQGRPLAVQAPEQQATVEVACALEGLAHCLEAASNGGDPEQEYAKHSQAAVDFLLSAQVLQLSAKHLLELRIPSSNSCHLPPHPTPTPSAGCCRPWCPPRRGGRLWALPQAWVGAARGCDRPRSVRLCEAAGAAGVR